MNYMDKHKVWYLLKVELAALLLNVSLNILYFYFLPLLQLRDNNIERTGSS